MPEIAAQEELAEAVARAGEVLADVHARDETSAAEAVSLGSLGGARRYPTPSSVNRMRGRLESASIFCRSLRTTMRR